MKVVALLLALGGLSAQIPGYLNGCSTCAVYGWVDTPGDNTTLDRAQPYYIGGWGFQCYTGQPVDRVDVFYAGDDGFDHVVLGSSIVDYGYRGDVNAAYSGTCPAVSTASVGFSAVFPVADIPAGTRLVKFNLWRGPYYEQRQRTYTFVN